MVTTDTSMPRKTGEALALRQAGISAIFVRGGFVNKRAEAQIAWLQEHWVAIELFASECADPFCVKINAAGECSEFELPPPWRLNL